MLMVLVHLDQLTDSEREGAEGWMDGRAANELLPSSTIRDVKNT